MSSILGLELRSHNLPHLKAFYSEQLRFPVLTDVAEELALQIGETQLAFTPPDDQHQPTYQFTIGVSQNRFDEIARSLAEKVTLLAREGQTVFHVSWRNTLAVYTLDPVGNLVEFAAVDAPDPTDADTSILGVIHVGLPVDDLSEANRSLQMRFGITNEIRNPNGAALISGGIQEPFFLLQAGSTTSFPMDMTAEVHPVMMTIAGSLNSVTKILDYPYYVHVSKTRGLFDSHVVTGRQ